MKVLRIIEVTDIIKSKLSRDRERPYFCKEVVSIGCEMTVHYCVGLGPIITYICLNEVNQCC